MNIYAGIGAKLLSVLMFSSMSALIKLVTDTMPTGQIIFARSFFALIPILVMLAVQRQFPHGLKTERPMGHFWRGLIGAAAMAAMFLSLSYLPLHDVVAIGYAAPLITVAIAPFMLGEKVGIYRFSAVVVGLVGVLIIVSPHLWRTADADRSLAGVGIALFGAIMMALAMIHVRRLTKYETNGAIVFYFTLMTTILGLATWPFGWVMPDGRQAILLVLIGLLGGVAQIFLTQGYRLAPVSTIAPFEYTSMLWALIFSFVLFADVPEPIVLVGAAIVIAAGIFVIFRERHLGLKQAKTPGVRSPHM